MQKTLLLALCACAAVTAGAATKLWTGGGSDDNLSTAANWSDGVAPVSGDALVFVGNVRTTPYNDYDPETTSFASLVFSNTCATAETFAPFTLSGNKIVLTCGNAFSVLHNGSIAVFTAHVPDTAKAIEDVVACDVTVKNYGCFGAYNASNHDVRFTGTVTAASSFELRSQSQMRGTVTFAGPVKGFSRVFRPNGSGGVIHLMSSENVFTSSAPAHSINEGVLRADSVAAVGGAASSFSFGQSDYNTPGSFKVNSQEDTEFTGRLVACGPDYTVGAGKLYNEVAGTTATFTGDLTCSKKGGALGTGVDFGGAGDGVFAGDVKSDFAWLYKRDAGMWTFSGTSSATGAVTVVGGTLRVNGDYSTAKRSVVKANATLGGTGKLGDVTFENGAALEVVDFAHPLHVSTLTPVGTVTLKMPHSAVMGTHTVLTYGARAGSGVFALSSDWPAGSVVAMGETALTVTVPSAVYTWTGAVSDSWDLTTANWAGGMSFLNGNSAVFDDTATRTDVVLSGVMQPVGVTVSGAKDYSFSGEGIGGSASITKTGTGRLTLKGAHGYTGFTKVGGGALVVEGALSGTSIHVASGAALTNTAASRLTGPGLIESFGAVELDGINEMTGGLFIKGGGVVKDIRALGAGDVTFGTGSNDRDVTLRVDGSCGQGKTLTCNSTAWLVVPGQKAFTWLGDVAMPRAQLKMQVDGVMTFGEPGGTNVIRDTGGSGFYLRNGGHYHFHSRIETRGRVEQTDYCTLHFYAPGSTWSQLTIAVGKAICHADNVLAPATVRMCQVWEKLSFNPVLDLNGFDQTITGLAIDTASLDVSSQTVTSETPATLTISNDVNTTTLRKQCTIKGAVTLRKKGAGTWTFGAKNATTGNVEVVEGTLALTAADALPMGANSTLFVSSGAKVSVADGVNVTVPYLVYNGFHLPPGVYRGTGGASGTVREDIFASGGGTLTVTRGKGGLTLIIR